MITGLIVVVVLQTVAITELWLHVWRLERRYYQRLCRDIVSARTNAVLGGQQTAAKCTKSQ